MVALAHAQCTQDAGDEPTRVSVPAIWSNVRTAEALLRLAHDGDGQRMPSQAAIRDYSRTLLRSVQETGGSRVWAARLDLEPPVAPQPPKPRDLADRLLRDLDVGAVGPLTNLRLTVEVPRPQGPVRAHLPHLRGAEGVEDLGEQLARDRERRLTLEQIFDCDGVLRDHRSGEWPASFGGLKEPLPRVGELHSRAATAFMTAGCPRT